MMSWSCLIKVMVGRPSLTRSWVHGPAYHRIMCVTANWPGERMFAAYVKEVSALIKSYVVPRLNKLLQYNDRSIQAVFSQPLQADRSRRTEEVLNFSRISVTPYQISAVCLPFHFCECGLSDPLWSGPVPTLSEHIMLAHASLRVGGHVAHPCLCVMPYLFATLCGCIYL